MAGSLQRYSLPPEQYAALRAHADRRAQRGSARWTRSASRDCSARTPRCCARSWRASRANRCPRKRSAPTCAASTAAAISRASDYHIVQEAGKRVMLITAAREIVGAGLPALRPRPRQRLPRRERFNVLGKLPQDMAQSAGRRMADGSPGRQRHAPVHRVLPAGRGARPLVRVAPYAEIGQTTRGVFVGRRQASPITTSAMGSWASTPERCSAPGA